MSSVTTSNTGSGASSTSASAAVGSNSAQVCPSCGSTDIDVDRSRGNAVCTGCGQVLEQNMIVNDTEFIATGVGDSKRAIGQFVGANERGMRSSFAGFHPGIQQEYLEVSLEKGRRVIAQHASVLSIHTHCSDLAHGFYKMLVERKFTRGRRTTLIAASCLYLACRNEQLPYLLFDFSDQLEESVTDLGRMYIRIAQELCINPPTVDPCLYIERFAERLDFGQETKDVAMTAMRILSRMKRDWIAAGRRPFGLCGAAIFLAAKLHGFHRPLSDIVTVVGAQVHTMSKRLKEFFNTATSKLTIEEFYLVDLDEEHDPPSFHQQKKKLGMKLPEFSEEEFRKLDLEIERNIDLERHNKGSNKQGAENYDKSEGGSSFSSGSSSGTNRYGLDLSEEMGLPKNTLLSVDGEIDGITDVLNSATNDDASADVDGGTGYLPVTCESLGIIDPLTSQPQGSSDPANCAGDNGNDEKVEDENIELFVDDLDDKEIDSYILSAEESNRKAVLWSAEYGDFMEKKEAKRKLKEEEKESSKDNKRRYKPRAPVPEGFSKSKKLKSTDRPAATANEAIDKIIRQKNISEKINLSVLQNLRIEKPLTTTAAATTNNTEDTKHQNEGVDASERIRSMTNNSTFADHLSSGKLTSRLASAFRKTNHRASTNSKSGSNKGTESKPGLLLSPRKRTVDLLGKAIPKT